ncbi:S1 family peptidase [Streptomyces sp. M41]|uniref:S1 family peptidase n=1 Tax=Streptomyces sp. M41 TaxID=3059412 RepID=UPI00374D4B53
MGKLDHRRKRKQTGVILAGAVLSIGAAATLLPAALADSEPAPTHKALTLQVAARLGYSLAGDLGKQKSAGWYYEGSTGKLVVNVVDHDAAARVTQDGAVARVVKYSAAQLDDVNEKLRSKAAIPGTYWSVDTRTNKISITADKTVVGTKWRQLASATEALGDAVTVERSAGTLKKFAADGGDEISSGGSLCSLGFNVTYRGAAAFLTAGHCGEGPWHTEAGEGTVAARRYPGSDYALVQYVDSQTSPPSSVDLHNGGTQQITQAVPAVVGMKVLRSGGASGVHGGTVTALDVTANYGDGPVSGLIGTDVCAEEGDSGGPLYSGTAAVGLTSGGNGDCSSGGETLFQPVTTALQATGALLGQSDGSGGGAGGAGGSVAGGAGDAIGTGSGGSDDGPVTGGDSEGIDAGGGSGIGEEDCWEEAIVGGPDGPGHDDGSDDWGSGYPPSHDDGADWGDHPADAGYYPPEYEDGAGAPYPPSYDESIDPPVAYRKTE